MSNKKLYKLYDEFVSYNLAVKMKELGFDWPCLGSFYTDIPENNIDTPEGKKDYRKNLMV